ncbi:Os04g0115700 [Oryza sativa Japonica Group]|uniref:Os04g0115700 protein n=1 Tax=Oryza sativa subsp. japonica TaxID=39947 RepID=A0A0P0W672_ORYSJ|nr:Os04g0115700 [Oryza sativa Japonica Group]
MTPRVHEDSSSWSGYCQSEVVERLCRGKSHSLGHRLMCWASRVVRVKCTSTAV